MLFSDGKVIYRPRSRREVIRYANCPNRQHGGRLARLAAGGRVTLPTGEAGGQTDTRLLLVVSTHTAASPQHLAHVPRPVGSPQSLQPAAAGAGGNADMAKWCLGEGFGIPLWMPGQQDTGTCRVPHTVPMSLSSCRSPNLSPGAAGAGAAAGAEQLAADTEPQPLETRSKHHLKVTTKRLRVARAASPEPPAPISRLLMTSAED